MNKRLLSVACILLLAAASCKKAELNELLATPDSVSTIQANIVSVSGPTSAAVNQEVNFVVSWPKANSYTAFRTFKTDTAGHISNVSLFVDSSSCQTCTIKTTAATYKFKPTVSGTYYLKFAGKDSTRTIVDTLVVR